MDASSVVPGRARGRREKPRLLTASARPANHVPLASLGYVAPAGLTGGARCCAEIIAATRYCKRICWFDFSGGGIGMSNGATKAPVSQIVVGVVIAALVAGVAGYWAGTQRGGGMAKAEERKLEIFHWWTAGGEREAADAMFKALKAKYPDIQLVENPVAGGGGVSHRVVLQARLSANLPPDTWQTLGGAELKSYVDGGYLAPLDSLYTEIKYSDAIPKPLANAVTIGGHPYVVPLNMHIQNILYYNKKLFDELGLKPPTTFDELLAAAKAIKAV